MVRQFKDQGWLWSEVRQKGPEQGPVRHYAVDYRRLRECARFPLCGVQFFA